MLVISSAELRNNMKKYLDIAKSEEVIIQISMDDLLSGVKEDIREMYRTAKQ